MMGLCLLCQGGAMAQAGPLYVYTDGQGPEYDENRKLQEGRFGTVALPLSVIMRTADATMSSFPGLTRKPAEFVDFLKSGLEKAKAGTAL